MMNVEAGTIQQLPQGTDLSNFKLTTQQLRLTRFSKTVLRQISAGLNVSYNSLSNDLTSVNYSSIRRD